MVTLIQEMLAIERTILPVPIVAQPLAVFSTVKGMPKKN